MMAYRGRRVIAPHILSLDIVLRIVAKFTPRTLEDWDRTPIPFAQKAGWAQEPMWESSRREKYLFPKGTLTSSLNYNTTVVRVETVF